MKNSSKLMEKTKSDEHKLPFFSRIIMQNSSFQFKDIVMLTEANHITTHVTNFSHANISS